MNNAWVKMIKPSYLNMSILGKRKTLVYEFWCDYIKQKYGDRANYAIQIQITLLFTL